MSLETAMHVMNQGRLEFSTDTERISFVAGRRSGSLRRVAFFRSLLKRHAKRNMDGHLLQHGKNKGKTFV